MLSFTKKSKLQKLVEELLSKPEDWIQLNLSEIKHTRAAIRVDFSEGWKIKVLDSRYDLILEASLFRSVFWKAQKTRDSMLKRKRSQKMKLLEEMLEKAK